MRIVFFILIGFLVGLVTAIVLLIRADNKDKLNWPGSGIDE